MSYFRQDVPLSREDKEREMKVFESLLITHPHRDPCDYIP